MASENTGFTAEPEVLAGVIFAVLGALGFSAKAVLIKLAYRYSVDAATLLALRMLFSLPFFLAVGIWSQRHGGQVPLTRRDHAGVVMLGLLGYYLASYLDFLGLQYISAGLERLILFLYPTLVVLISALWLKRPIVRREGFALLLSYGGIALAFFNDSATAQNDIYLGAALIFASALAFAIYLIGGGQLIVRLGASRFTAYAMTVSVVAALAQFFLTHPVQALRQPAPVYWLSLTMAILSTVLPAFLMSAGIRRIGASRAALIATIGPVSTILLAHAFLGETISSLQMVGTVLVCTGTVMVSRRNAATGRADGVKLAVKPERAQTR
jgi:drug/metabolite transporter (DMT)-like permease